MSLDHKNLISNMKLTNILHVFAFINESWAIIIINSGFKKMCNSLLYEISCSSSKQYTNPHALSHNLLVNKWHITNQWIILCVININVLVILETFLLIYRQA